MWSHPAAGLPLTVTIDGNVVASTDGTTRILAARFDMGRGDWFDQLSGAMASFEFSDDVVPESDVGKTVVVDCDGPLWTGRVDSVVTTYDLAGAFIAQTVTAIDQVALLGQARLEDENLTGPDGIHTQLVDVFGFAGLTPTVLVTPVTFGLATLDSINPLAGSVLDWVNLAELDSNVIIAPNADGDIIITYRGSPNDYEARALSDLAGSVVPAAASSFWRMDEASGDILDSTGAARDGLDAGTPTYGQTGAWGADGPDAVAFQKADAADRFTFGDTFDLQEANWTLAGMAYWAGAAGSDDSILSKMNATDTDGWEVIIDQAAAALRFRVRNASSTTVDVVTGNGTVPTNTWFQWAVVKEGSDLRIYVARASTDWVPALLVTGTAAVPPNISQHLNMGSRAGTNRWFGGRMQMVGIWAFDALTADELEGLINPPHVVADGVTAPIEWSRTVSVTTVINHWVFRQFAGVSGYSNGASITAHGDHTFEHESNAVSALDDTYSAAMRATLANPRPTIATAWHVSSDAQSDIVHLQPLDYVVRPGFGEWQVMSVAHDITPVVWQVTVALSGTVASLSTGVPLLPV
jgi:hypothetical protein